MFEKLMSCYFLIVALNCSANKLNVGAYLSKRSKLFNNMAIAVTEANDMWQPMMQSGHLLPTPTKSGASESLRRPHSKNIISVKVKGKQNFTLSNAGNYGKQSTRPSKATTQLTTHSTLMIPAEFYMKSKTHFQPLTEQNSNNNNTNTNTTENAKYQFNSYQWQHSSLNHKAKENQYPPIQVSKNIMQSEQEHPKFSPLPHQSMNQNSSVISHSSNFNYLADVTKHKELTIPSSPSSLSHNTPQAKHIAIIHNDTKGTASTTNFAIKRSDDNTNKINNILPTTLNSLFFSNKDLIDDIKESQHQNNLINHKTNSDIIALKTASKETAEASKIATADRNSNCDEKFLDKLLNSSEGFDDCTRHKNSSKNYPISGNNYHDKQHDPDVFLKKDAAYDDINPEVLTSAAQQFIKATSETLAAGIAAALKKLESFDVKNIFSSASTAASSFLSLFQDANENKRETDAAKFKSTPTTDTNIITQLRNLSTEYEIVSGVATSTTTTPTPTYTSTFDISIAPTSTPKSSTAVSSGRKMKKVKKKFQQLQQFLLPLLLAYKLKFLALIPLLAGGLVLLVGSTGLAGFFFALFTAVMSLKAGHESAIVVKKYL